MARSRSASHDDVARWRVINAQRGQQTSVGELLRPDEVPAAAPSRGYPPRPAQQLPTPAPNAARPPSGRRFRVATEDGVRTAATPARPTSGRGCRENAAAPPAVEAERPPRITGAFRRALPGSQAPPSAHSRGRSPSCGPSDQARPRASSAGRAGRDIVSENRMAAVQRPRAASAGRAPPKEVRFACDSSGVPEYLQKVKSAIAQEERTVAQHLGLDRDPAAPPGHRWLSDDERQVILAGLQKRSAGLEARFSRLPLHVDTEAQKQRARDLEKALEQVEHDIARFSQPRVLLKE